MKKSKQKEKKVLKINEKISRPLHPVQKYTNDPKAPKLIIRLKKNIYCGKINFSKS
jgi:hypothetical protein